MENINGYNISRNEDFSEKKLTNDETDIILRALKFYHFFSVLASKETWYGSILRKLYSRSVRECTLTFWITERIKSFILMEDISAEEEI